MSADVQTASAGVASESGAAAAAPSSSVASAAAALAAASSASAASPKEERKVGKLNMAAFSNAGAGDSAAAADKGAAGPGGGKAVGKLGVKMQIPLFSPGKGPAGPGGNQTMPGAKRHSLTTGDSNGSDGGADASGAAAGTPSNGSSFGSGGGPGSMRGMGTAPGKLQANSLMNNLNAMLVGGPRKPRSGSISGEDGAAQGQQVAASAVTEENKEDGSNEPAPTITHAKRARVNRKARTKPTELAKAGITTGFTAVEISQSKVAAITLVSVVKEAAPAEAAPTATASEQDANASASDAAQSQEAAASGATTTLDGSSSEAESNAATAAAPAVAAAVTASPSKPSPPNYPKPPPPRQPKPIEEEAQAEPVAAAAAAESAPAGADTEPEASAAAPIAAVPSSSSSSDSAPTSSSSSSSSLAAPLADASQRAAWSAASLYGDFVDPEFDESKADEYRLLTAAGGEFLKHGKSGKPHPRLVFVTSALMLMWAEPGKRSAKPDPKSSINLALASIPKIAVVKGKSTPNFQRSTAAKVDPALCLSITAPRDRNLDLEARSQEERDAWYAAFKFLLNEAQLAREKALVYGAMH